MANIQKPVVCRPESHAESCETPVPVIRPTTKRPSKKREPYFGALQTVFGPAVNVAGEKSLTAMDTTLNVVDSVATTTTSLALSGVGFLTDAVQSFVDFREAGETPGMYVTKKDNCKGYAARDKKEVVCTFPIKGWRIAVYEIVQDSNGVFGRIISPCRAWVPIITSRSRWAEKLDDKLVFRIGMQVQAQDRGESSWTMGSVTSARPLKVNSRFWDRVVPKDHDATLATIGTYVTKQQVNVFRDLSCMKSGGIIEPNAPFDVVQVSYSTDFSKVCGRVNEPIPGWVVLHDVKTWTRIAKSV